MSQVNRNYVYLTTVDGHTVWERLRVIRNFLTDRRQAIAITKMNNERFEENRATMDKWALREYDIMHGEAKELLQDAEDEVAFLERLEARLMEEAEKERVDGLSDREMYEYNYPNEVKHRMIHRCKAEIMTVGHIMPETMSDVLKHPNILHDLIDMGILSEEVVKVQKLSHIELPRIGILK